MENQENTSSPQPTPFAKSQMEPAVQPAKQGKLSNRLPLILVAVAVIGIITPGGGGAWILAILIMFIGTFAALKFIHFNLKNLKNYSPIVQPFVVIASLGIGAVMFFGAAFAAMIAALFKVPPDS